VIRRFSYFSLIATLLTSHILSGLAPALALPAAEAIPTPAPVQPSSVESSPGENGPVENGSVESSPVESSPAAALPPATDIPEEILRTQIIVEARSPVNGEPITAAEYAEALARQEEQQNDFGVVPPKIRRLIGLLRLRKALRTIFPFIP
jgi:hypothetical protein